MVACVDVVAKDLLHAALEKFTMMNTDQSKAQFLSPEKTLSSTTEVFVTPTMAEGTTINAVGIATGSRCCN
jgi:hypothetical protein